MTRSICFNAVMYKDSIWWTWCQIMMCDVFHGRSRGCHSSQMRWNILQWSDQASHWSCILNLIEMVHTHIRNQNWTLEIFRQASWFGNWMISSWKRFHLMLKATNCDFAINWNMRSLLSLLEKVERLDWLMGLTSVNWEFPKSILFKSDTNLLIMMRQTILKMINRSFKSTMTAVLTAGWSNMQSNKEMIWKIEDFWFSILSWLDALIKHVTSCKTSSTQYRDSVSLLYLSSDFSSFNYLVE